MKNFGYYLLFVLTLVAATLAGCDSNSNTDDPDDDNPPIVTPQEIILQSIEASIEPFLNGSADPDFIANSFAARYAAGQSMSVYAVKSGGTRAVSEKIYKFEGGKWVPAGTPVAFTEGEKYEVHFKLEANKPQDGSQDAFLLSDDLFCKVDDLEPAENLKGIKLNHQKVLVAINFPQEGPSPQGFVTLGDTKAYKHTDNDFYVIIGPDDEHFNIEYTYYGTEYSRSVDCTAGGGERLSFSVNLKDGVSEDPKPEVFPNPSDYSNQRKYDGPFILFGEGDNRTYIVRNPDGTLFRKENIIISNIDVYTHNLNYNFKVPVAPPTEQEAVMASVREKTLVVSDLHGRFEAFYDILTTQGVINDKFEWTFGTNHMVFVGDVFDRGRDDVPILWLLYKLQKDAEAKGGRIDYLVGNHEDLVLKDDLRYVNTDGHTGKYYSYSTDKGVYYDTGLDVYKTTYGITYGALFGKQTELGSWVRNRNMVIKVDDILFVHGGLSIGMVNKDYDIAKINDVSKKAMGLSSKSSVSGGTTVFDSSSTTGGPIWYRGMVKDDSNTITGENLNKVLEYYGASKVIVGHTVVDDIEWRFGGRVIAVNVEHKTNHANNLKNASKVQTAALVIEKNGGEKKFYSVDYKGNVIKRFN